MYARRRSTRRRPSRNSARSAPSTAVANNCNPTVSSYIDYSYFRNSVLPVALANKWIEVTTTPILVTGLYSISGDRERYELPPNCVGFYTSFNATDGELQITVENEKGSQAVTTFSNVTPTRTMAISADVQGVRMFDISNGGSFRQGLFEEPTLSFLTAFISNDIQAGTSFYVYTIESNTELSAPLAKTLFVNPTKSSLIMERVTSHL